MNDESRSSYFSKGVVVFTLAMVYCVLGGSAFPSIKLGYSLFNIKSGATAAIILFAGVRFTLAGMATIVTGSIIHKSFLFPAKGNFSKGLASVFMSFGTKFATISIKSMATH